MSTANLILEGAVNTSNGEPYAETIRQGVTYLPERPSSISGTIVMGVEIKESQEKPFYNLFRKDDAALFNLEDNEGSLTIGLMKITWDDIPDVIPGFVILRDKTTSVIKEEESGIEWKFLLVQQEEGNDYTLIHMEAGPGAVDKCKAIKESCGETLSCKVKLALNGCPLG